MPKIELELTDEDIANLANGGGVFGNPKSKLTEAAKEYVSAKTQGTVLADLAKQLDDYKVDSKVKAIEAISILRDVHEKIENKLASLGLEYEIRVSLGDGRYLDLYGHSYHGGQWMTSSDNC